MKHNDIHEEVSCRSFTHTITYNLGYHCLQTFRKKVVLLRVEPSAFGLSCQCSATELRHPLTTMTFSISLLLHSESSTTQSQVTTIKEKYTLMPKLARLETVKEWWQLAVSQFVFGCLSIVVSEWASVIRVPPLLMQHRVYTTPPLENILSYLTNLWRTA